jgi:hypothetical protein
VWSVVCGPALCSHAWTGTPNATQHTLCCSRAHTRTFFMVSVPAAEDRSANSTNPAWPRTDRAGEGTSFTILMPLAGLARHNRDFSSYNIRTHLTLCLLEHNFSHQKNPHTATPTRHCRLLLWVHQRFCSCCCCRADRKGASQAHA